MSFTRVSHIATSVLTGCWTLPNQLIYHHNQTTRNWRQWCLWWCFTLSVAVSAWVIAMGNTTGNLQILMIWKLKPFMKHYHGRRCCLCTTSSFLFSFIDVEPCYLEIISFRFTYLLVSSAGIIIRQPFSSHLAYLSDLVITPSENNLRCRQIMTFLLCSSSSNQVDPRCVEMQLISNN